MMLRVLAILVLLTLPVTAEEAVVGMSQNRIAITANFDGSEILIFGAIKREAPAPTDSKIDVIIAVTGPSKPVTVRRKSRVFGIWVNTAAVDVDAAPSFYAVATTGPLDEILKATEDLRYKISIPRAIRSVGAPMTIIDAASFTDALIRIRSKEGLYLTKANLVEVDEQTLFDTSITLPANLTEGAYSARIYLLRNGNVIDTQSAEIDVQKVGLERWLYGLAHNQPLAYGILSLVIAIGAGWSASAVFRFFKA
jgi:uncharacterized protein (TIGR02186 family)